MSRFRTFSLVIAIGVAAGLSITGCGDNSSSSPSSTSTTSTTSAITTSTTTSTSPATTVAPDATAGVTKAFTTFFDGANRDVDSKIRVLENGEKYRTMLVDAAANPQVQQMSARVKTVRLMSGADCTALNVTSPCAAVELDVLVGSFPAVAGLQGIAVSVDGSWKVAARVWCNVVAIGGAKCPD